MIKATAAGDRGLLLDTDLPPAWLAAAIQQARLPGVVDVVPGAATVLVLVKPGTTAWGELAARIAGLPVAEPQAAVTAAVEIPVDYDGPDLADVAELSGLSVAEVVEAHAAGIYTVGWLGFCPGFGYLTGLDQRLSGVPRLETPRRAVPAGSVAIAAGLAAVYPSASPGGWRLLGRTAVRMWDQDREPPALLMPGQHVRFVPAAGGVRSGHSPKPKVAEPPPSPVVAAAMPRPVAPCLEVIKPGPLATVQDLGRLGQGAFGVPPSGAADPVSLIAANRLVGNPDGAACVELTLGRAMFRCHGDLAVAVTGAPATVTVDASDGVRVVPVEFGNRFDAADGAVISVGAPPSGLRCYIAVTGGLDVPVVLGSCSTDLLSGLGGGPLQSGAMLPVGIEAAHAGDSSTTEVPRTGTRVIARGDVAQLRVVGGPRLDWFEADALDRLCAGVYTVTAASNRTGLRLDGEPVPSSIDAELPSEGLVTGSLQVPPDGMPILHLADHPTVGGYPVIAVVVSADIGQAGQLRPGNKLRFINSPR